MHEEAHWKFVICEVKPGSLDILKNTPLITQRLLISYNCSALVHSTFCKFIQHIVYVFKLAWNFLATSSCLDQKV